MSQPTHDHDIAGKLADWCTDFDGSPMSPAEAPLDGLHCDDLYSAINEILALRTRAEAAEKRCEELEAAMKPFADEAGCYDPDEGDDNYVAWGSDFTIGSLRNARALLSTKEGG